ncbi:tetratricopeptide repeat-containing glycosyltransferase family 2 protein [Alicyclobacillus acidocaldarius]|uniref:tetratricopeptide repeat-containing glycosyltransferase family 2 protein n=1 Tax=Alicyclobacillus acidocaldarius TaxID=405212 RepID=UPI0013052B02|nr:glycosyltransferase [Alicyclobacillus acidocaldarius]
MVSDEVIRQKLLDGAFDEARKLALEQIKGVSWRAQSWVFLGEACLRLGNGKIARRCFERAWLLDPMAPWVNAVMKACDEVSAGKRDREVESALRVPKTTVSALVLFRDDARTIKRCIEALRPAVDEIIAVDTGSTDGSDVIASAFGAQVYRFEWTGDFAAARNFGLSKVTSQWVIAIDSDEILYAEDVDAIRTIAGVFESVRKESPVILRIVQMNLTGETVTPATSQSRMFPTGEDIEWRGLIHETPTLTKETARPAVRALVRIRVYHDGYDPKHVDLEKKFRRNLELLTEALEREPNNPVYEFYIGRESLFLKDYTKSIEYLERAEQHAKEIAGFSLLPDIRRRLAQAYMLAGKNEHMANKLEDMVKEHPEYPDGWFLRGEKKLREAGVLLQEAAQDFAKAQEAAQKYRGITEYDTAIGLWKAPAQLGEIARMRGNLVEARRWYQRVLKQEPNLKTIRERLEKLEQEACAIAQDVQEATKNTKDE